MLNELVDGESGVVWLDNGVRDHWGWDNGESGHHTVWEFFTDLGDQEGTHTGTGTTTEGVGDLEALEAVAAFGLTTDNIDDLVDQVGTLSVVTLSPVVSGTRLTEDDVIGAEKLTERTGTDSIESGGLKINKNRTGNVFFA